MTETATMQRTGPDDEPPEPVLTQSGPIHPILVPELATIPRDVKTASERAGLTLVHVHTVTAPTIQLDVQGAQGLFDQARQAGAKRVYLWKEPLHPNATAEAQLAQLRSARSDIETDVGDDEEREAAAELAQELDTAAGLLEEHGTLMYGVGFLCDGVMHEVFIGQEAMTDAMIVLASLLELSGGRDDDDDDDDDLVGMESDEAADRIVEHVEEEMDVPAREMRRRANELARQAAHRMVDPDDLSPADRQRLQQAIKLAAVRMRKGE